MYNAKHQLISGEKLLADWKLNVISLLDKLNMSKQFSVDVNSVCTQYKLLFSATENDGKLCRFSYFSWYVPFPEYESKYFRILCIRLVVEIGAFY